ncbi:DExH-box ATP-dependent RNA helicase DExH8-like [Hibiscus syriacus]|nr:DExH-box ATP-dependent RNA helicase DExH8-like [Hibiscus syriacus]
MRDKGFQALKYKVIILDEVHERSIESDLVLVCVKQFLLKNKDLRVVLMSATVDIGRYRDYFRDLGRGDRVEVLGIPSSSQKEVFQRQVSYLEQLKPNLDKELDPMAGIMDLMKNMYEEGDEDMKRTIAKAWTDARSGKTGDSLKGFR